MPPPVPAATESTAARSVPAATAGLTLHGTVVAWRGKGVLLQGPSGSGKSDLALRLVEAGAVLVADDLVRVEPVDGRLVARAAREAGLLELRHQGIFRLPAQASTAVDLVVRLEPPADAGERLPPPESCALAGLLLPVVRLDPRTASAVARLGLLLAGERVV